MKVTTMFPNAEEIGNGGGLGDSTEKMFIEHIGGEECLPTAVEVLRRRGYSIVEPTLGDDPKTDRLPLKIMTVAYIERKKLPENLLDCLDNWEDERAENGNLTFYSHSLDAAIEDEQELAKSASEDPEMIAPDPENLRLLLEIKAFCEAHGQCDFQILS